MTPDQVVSREAEHIRRRAASARAKMARHRQLVLAIGAWPSWIIDAPIYNAADFPGFSPRQIEAGLTVPATADAAA